MGCGRFRNRPGANNSSSRIAPAPTSPGTWVFAPLLAATAVRDPLVLTGNPSKNPAATFTAPMPMISLLPSTRSPLRAATADAVETVSVNDANAIPNVPANSNSRSPSGTVGMVNGGNPSGSGPITLTSRSVRSSRWIRFPAAPWRRRCPAPRSCRRRPAECRHRPGPERAERRRTAARSSLGRGRSGRSGNQLRNGTATTLAELARPMGSARDLIMNIGCRRLYPGSVTGRN